MVADSVAEQVCQAVADQLQIDRAEVTPETVLLDLGAQSLDFVQLVFCLDEAFGIKLPASCSTPDEHRVQTYIDAVFAGLVTRLAAGVR